MSGPGPYLEKPIDEDTFRAEFLEIWDRAPAALRKLPIRLILDPRLDRIHVKNPRRFAEMDPSRLSFHFAHETLRLAKKYRLALVAHEIGHALHGDATHTEAQADAAALRYLGVEITYDRRNFPGKGLQVARDLYRRRP